jgi:hypothetical protein
MTTVRLTEHCVPTPIKARASTHQASEYRAISDLEIKYPNPMIFTADPDLAACVDAHGWNRRCSWRVMSDLWLRFYPSIHPALLTLIWRWNCAYWTQHRSRPLWGERERLLRNYLARRTTCGWDEELSGWGTTCLRPEILKPLMRYSFGATTIVSYSLHKIPDIRDKVKRTPSFSDRIHFPTSVGMIHSGNRAKLVKGYQKFRRNVEKVEVSKRTYLGL